MEWQVRIKEHPHLIDVPNYLIANTVVPAKLDKRDVLLRWNPLHQTFFVCETSKLERCFRVRNVTIEYDSQTDEKLIRFHLASKDATVIEALLYPLSHSRAVRTKMKKKRMDKQLSPLTGKVAKLYVKVGDVIRKGDPVAIIEAMKMENKILSEMTGIVKTVQAIESSKINMGDEIFSTSPIKK
jgi:biotin carboxyl carrier protein